MTVFLANERDYYPTVIDAAHWHGWIVAHFRPGRTKGQRYVTPVQGDAVGFPDFVFVHGGAGLVWYVEVKRDDGRLTPAQRRWGETLITAGAVFKVIHVPSGLDVFLADLADAVRPSLTTHPSEAGS